MGCSPGDHHEKPAPGLTFVLDDNAGIYILSNGQPYDLIASEHRYHAYAEDCDPDNNDDGAEACIKHCRALAGSEPFMEVIPIYSDWVEACCNFQWFVVEVNSETQQIKFVDFVTLRKLKDRLPIPSS
jgi:hypothetical protein